MNPVNWDLLFFKTPRNLLHAWPPRHLKQYALFCTHFTYGDTANEQTKVTIPINMIYGYILLSPKLWLWPNSVIYIPMHCFPNIYWALPMSHTLFLVLAVKNSDQRPCPPRSDSLQCTVPFPWSVGAPCSTMVCLSQLERLLLSIRAKQMSLGRGLSVVTARTFKN